MRDYEKKTGIIVRSCIFTMSQRINNAQILQADQISPLKLSIYLIGPASVLVVVRADNERSHFQPFYSLLISLRWKWKALVHGLAPFLMTQKIMRP
jgi:hypothetical protein